MHVGHPLALGAWAVIVVVASAGQCAGTGDMRLPERPEWPPQQPSHGVLLPGAPGALWLGVCGSEGPPSPGAAVSTAGSGRACGDGGSAVTKCQCFRGACGQWSLLGGGPRTGSWARTGVGVAWSVLLTASCALTAAHACSVQFSPPVMPLHSRESQLAQAGRDGRGAGSSWGSRARGVELAH